MREELRRKRQKTLVNILVGSDTLKSRSEAKRLIRQGAIEIDGRTFRE